MQLHCMRDRYRNKIFVTGEIIFLLELKMKEKPKKPSKPSGQSCIRKVIDKNSQNLHEYIVYALFCSNSI